jgi:small subunit ribosomal protein S21
LTLIDAYGLSFIQILTRKVVILMPGIRINEGESFENAVKRFKKQVEKGGILSDIRKKEFYEKPSVRKKKKAIAARKRALKKTRRPF